MSVVHEGFKQASDYILRLLMYELAALEGDMLHGKGLRKLVFREEGPEATEATYGVHWMCGWPRSTGGTYEIPHGPLG